MKQRKWFTVLLTLAIVFGLIPIRASASDTGLYTVSVINNDYATGGKSTGSSLSVDKAECLAGETVVITADLKPGTGFYHFDGDEDGPSVWKADASEQLDVVKVSDTVYTFVMPACDVNVAGRFTFLRYTVQLEGFDSGIAGLRNVLTSVNGTTVQNTSPFTAQYGDSIEIDTYGSSQFVVGISYTYTENGQTTTKPVTDIQQPNYDQYVGTFTMPASDVTVSLSKVGTVYLQKGAVTGGTVLLGKDFVIPGDTVTLTGVPSNAALFDPADAVWDIHGTADPSQKVSYTVDPTDPWKVSFAMPSYNVTVDAAFGLDYVATSWNGAEVVTENALCDNPINLATVTDQEGITIGDGNWYYAGNDIAIENRLTIRGTANLILCDGATVTPVLGIQLNTFGELNIWGQSAGTGTLTVTKSNDIENQAGIGGDDGGNAGPLNMHGGKILINGTADGGAGIGGGRNGNGGTVNVYGGELRVDMERIAYDQTYHSGDCAGIGGGKDGSGGTVRIYDGVVYALGGAYGAGIGGGKNGNGGTLEVYGGEVTAKAGINGAGIGGGENGNGGTVTISGGTVTATSYKGFEGGAGIGGGEGGYGGTVTISGGAVTAKCLGSYAAGIGSGDDYEGKAGIITISGGTVTAYGGVNGAGIGGGEESAGADVTITGGTVIAYSGNISSSFYDYAGAIGKGSGAGEGADEGSLVIYDTATVYAGAKDSEVSRVTADSRTGSARTNRYASITPCEHSYGDWTEVDDSTHARHCRYCLESEVGQHTFGDGFVCTACGCEHTHIYGEWIGKIDSDCENAGTLGHFTCTICGRFFDGEYNELTDLTIPAKGHKWSEPVFMFSDDGSSATVTRTCANAGHPETKEAIITTEVTKAPTCEGKGETTFTASAEFDGETFTSMLTLENIDAKGHVWNDGVISAEPTCIAAGALTYSCNFCDAEIVETLAMDPTNHTGSDSQTRENIVPSTCTQEGSYTEVVTCECGAEISRTENVALPLNPDAHQAGEPVSEVITPATHDTDGVRTVTVMCVNCGATLSEKTETIPATGGDTPDAPDTPDTPDTPDAPAQDDTLCKWDNVDHGTSFWGRLVHFFHSILYFFARLFGKR